MPFTVGLGAGKAASFAFVAAYILSYMFFVKLPGIPKTKQNKKIYINVGAVKETT